MADAVRIVCIVGLSKASIGVIHFLRCKITKTISVNDLFFFQKVRIIEKVGKVVVGMLCKHCDGLSLIHGGGVCNQDFVN